MTLCESRPTSHLDSMLPFTIVSSGTNLLEHNSNMDALHQRGNAGHGSKLFQLQDIKVSACYERGLVYQVKVTLSLNGFLMFTNQ